MNANAKKRPSGAVMSAIQRAAIDDELDEILAMPDDALDRSIAESGGDPAQIRSGGAKLARELFDRRTRLAWHAATEHRIEAFRAKAEAARQKEPLPRWELLARLEFARRDPRLATPVAMMFQKKSAEAATDEELQAMLDEIELLADGDEEGDDE
ncbi:MAG: hypothetical protein ACHREM_20570 [Polyangiales bacterium]